MARPKQDKSVLGDSWVVNDSSDYGDDDDSSHKEDDVANATSLHQSRTSKSLDSKYIHSKDEWRQGQSRLNGDAPPRRRSSRATSKEPELIMPSIYEDGMARSPNKIRRNKVAAVDDIQQNPKRRSKRSSTSSTMFHEPDDDNGASAEMSRQARSRRGDPASASTVDDVLAVMQPIGQWIWDVIGGAFRALTTPVSYAIALYMLLGLSYLVANFFTNSFYSALSPICRIPGASLLNLPMCKNIFQLKDDSSTGRSVEFDQLMTVQSKFEDILEQSATGITLPLDMKRGETSIRDLRQIVRFSNLQSRNELVLEFDGFIETARGASFDLQKFNSHVGRAVDNVINTARWTRRVLDDISTSQSSRGLITRLITNRLLAPFQPIRSNAVSEATLLDQYLTHTRTIENEIADLILEAQALLHLLTNLEDRLEVIHAITTREGISIRGSKEEVLSQLWTFLGGNRVALGKFNSQLNLLHQVGEYRKTAFAHLTATVLRLQAMGAELEELRERVGTVEVLGRGTLPLEVYISNIEDGVERLEAARGESKRLENEHLRRALDRGKEAESGRLIEG